MSGRSSSDDAVLVGAGDEGKRKDDAERQRYQPEDDASDGPVASGSGSMR